MNIILLSGGSGKRLWPLSNDIRSKQFIKIFKKSDGEYASMVQRIYDQIKTVDPDAKVTIATSKSQVSSIHNQLGYDVGISVEPCRRDTFAAIALATAYLHDEKQVPENEAVVVCPVDPYVDFSYFECVNKLYEKAEKGDKNLVLMGIQPTYPSDKYGYIKPIKDEKGNAAYAFTEKPTEEKAKEYIEAGALWNGGVFAYKLSYVLDKAKELLGTSDYAELFSDYENLRKISFDYAVVENEKSIEVVRYEGEWKDVGTWNTLTEVMDENIIGNGQVNDQCANVHIINELGIPILGMGLKDMVISASPEGILVSDKEQSAQIKPYVDAIDQQIMFADKSWGTYRILDVEENSLTIKATLKPGHRMNYHSHEHRDEIWNVIQGTGKTIVDGMEQPIKPGDVVTMAAGTKHTVIAGDEGLQLIEVQLGKDINVGDKKKYEL
ncbi:mannose-1-phosphate guanylyltransferase [Oribacterium sp. KHPX15]|uniref:sugar phosphate nucleotidyltransferase n=1 Tax=Oribacterium sp. KHPX15 TaxID=1855342 RepID=UPI00089954AD|nr:sugar phosphate nucleotidyltransferase [Oribacterium sp. KHPX15]SEA57346.1 mannose-1-phosphate guanylyltransferase [Oribacterium sp. KHPX15]